jgi:hypothetical protein
MPAPPRQYISTAFTPPAQNPLQQLRQHPHPVIKHQLPVQLQTTDLLHHPHLLLQEQYLAVLIPPQPELLLLAACLAERPLQQQQEVLRQQLPMAAGQYCRC